MTSGADIAIAVGTIATAALAAAGLGVSLHINSKDRTQAETLATDDRKAAARVSVKDRASAARVAEQDRAAAAQLAADDRALARQEAERRHIVDLLLDLGRQIASQSADQHNRDAVQQCVLLLNALPGECAYAARQRFGVTDRHMAIPGAVGEKMSHLDLASVGGNADPGQMFKEIAYDIDRYMTSNLPPGEVWNDVDELRKWQRTRFPRRP